MQHEPPEPSHETAEETREAREPRRRLLLVICLLLALPLGLGAFFVAHLGNEESLHQFWMHVLLELSVALLSFAVISMIVNSLHERMHDPLGVDEVFRKWIREVPRASIRREFTTASEVEIIGISLYNSFIYKSWFEKQLVKRLNAGMHTRFLFLRKNGQEINRRNDEPRKLEPPTKLSVRDRNNLSHQAVERAHKESGNGHLHDVLRSFDYSPGVNYLRFGDVAYIVFVSERGGFSPALKVRKGSLLYQHYKEMFAFIWDRHNPKEMAAPRLPIQAKPDVGSDHIQLNA